MGLWRCVALRTVMRFMKPAPQVLINGEVVVRWLLRQQQSILAVSHIPLARQFRQTRPLQGAP
jgi:hypothetical protein